MHQPELEEDDMIYMNRSAILVWLCVLSVISVASVVCLVVLLIKRGQLLNFQKSDGIQ